jgi:hypothetical protein
MAEGVAGCGSRTSLSGWYLVGVVELNKEGGETTQKKHRTDPPPPQPSVGQPNPTAGAVGPTAESSDPESDADLGTEWCEARQASNSTGNL